MKKTFLTLAAVATMLAACNNNDSIPVVDELTDTPIVVNAGIAELTSRAGMTTSDLADLGLHIENEVNSKYSFVNIEFEKDANTGGFVLAGTTVPLWQNATQKITVWAYSPYNAGWDDVFVKQEIEVKTSQDVEEDVKASDLLWAKADVDPAATVQYGDIKYNAGALDITLEHILSKIIVNVRFGSELTDISDVPTRGLTLDNFNTRGTVILFDASVGSTPNTVAKIYAYKNATAPNGYNSSFEAILLPQKSKFKVEIGLEDGRNFAWESSEEFSFTPRRSYTLNLVVGKDKVELDNAGITAKDWGTPDNWNGSLETE